MISDRCISDLQKIHDSFAEVEEKNAADCGYNTAVFCIKEGISTRISLLRDIHEEPTSSPGYVSDALEFIEGLLKVIGECADEADEDIRPGYVRAFEELICRITPTLEWLNKI